MSARAQVERERRASVAVTFEVVDRDVEVAGGIIAGALAYRLFLWLLPLALVLVAGLGIAADAASETPRQAAESLGLAGLVSQSVASTAESSARWYALLVGCVALLVASRSALRALIASHRLVWIDVRGAAPKPTATATLRLCALLLCFFLVTGLASTLRARSAGLGTLGSVLVAVPYAGIWLLVSARLPHRDARWSSLVPGALAFGFGITLIQVVAAYAIAPYAITKQGTYGALGVAAGLLIGLFLVGRLVVVAAALNATLWDRSTRAKRSTRAT